MVIRNTILVLLVLCIAPLTSAVSEEVTVPGIPNSDHSIRSLPGWLFLPDEPGDSKIGVVYLHGCDGSYGPYNFANMERWANWYTEWGIAFLAVESHRPRNKQTQCRLPHGYDIPVQRSLDALAAMKFLITNGYVDKGKVLVHGASQGGGVALHVLQNELVGNLRFAGGIGMYPSCQTGPFKGYAPAIILIGGRDTWTKASRCQSMAKRTGEDSASLTVFTYPDAVHSFDYSFSPVRGTEGHFIGSHSGALADSKKRIEAFIEGLFPGW